MFVFVGVFGFGFARLIARLVLFATDAVINETHLLHILGFEDITTVKDEGLLQALTNFLEIGRELVPSSQRPMHRHSLRIGMDPQSIQSDL